MSDERKYTQSELEEKYNAVCSAFTAESKALKIEVEEARKSELKVKHKYNELKEKFDEILEVCQGYEKMIKELTRINDELTEINKILTEKIEKSKNDTTHEPEEKKDHDEEIVAILYGIVL